MKTIKLSSGEKQAILKLRKESISIDQRHCTSIGDSLANNLACPEKERNLWHTEQQTSNRSTKVVLHSSMNLYQSNGKAKVRRKKGSAHDPKHTSISL